MADRDYKFPPIGGWGNPAKPWHYNFGDPPVKLTGFRGTAMLMTTTLKRRAIDYKFRAYAPIGNREGVNSSGFLWAGSIETLYPAATIARSSASDDTPANQWVPDLMEPTLNFGRSLFDGVEPTSIASPAAGIIDLIDPTGMLEYFYDYIWDGAEIIIKRGHRDQPFSTWAEVGVFTGAAVIGSLDKITVRLRDLGWKLAASLHDETYDGLGGLGGDETLKGVRKPYCVGYCFNVEPVPINGASEIFQFSFMRSEAVFELRHGGVPLTFSADYATYDGLVAASVPSGRYATCLNQSLVRTNVTLNFSIRVDVAGDNTTQNGHTTPLTRAAIARRIATCYGTDHNLDDEFEIDIASFERVEQDHTGTLGFFWRDEVSKAEALNEVMMGICGWWHIKPNGQLAIGYAREPTDLVSVQDIDYKSEGMGPFEIVDTAVPRWQTKVGWRKNYAIQSLEQIAGSVSLGDATLYHGQMRYAEVSDTAVQALYPTARTVTINGGFWDEVDAQVEAQRQQIMMGKERNRYRCEMEIDPFADLINQCVTVVGVNRLGMGPRKTLLCVGMDTKGIGSTALDWWG